MDGGAAQQSLLGDAAFESYEAGNSIPLNENEAHLVNNFLPLSGSKHRVK